MKKLLLILLALVVYALHQDFWYFDKLNIHLGFLPVGLWYQALFVLLCSFTMTTVIGPPGLLHETLPQSR